MTDDATYCKALCDVKFRQIEGNDRIFLHLVPTGEEGGEEEQPRDLLQEDPQGDLRPIQLCLPEE